MAGANVLHFDDSNFDAEVLQSSQPVLVDFWATWCGPCQMLAPTIDELATEYAGRVKVGKVDIEQAMKAATTYGIQSVPTVMVFQNGKPVDRIIGARSKKDYKALLDAKVAAK